MRKKYLIGLSVSIVLFFYSCNTVKTDQKEKARSAIANAEKEFDKMVAEKGLMEAFGYFAAPDAIIRRGNDSLIKGKENIRNFYSTAYYKRATVTWSPDFIDVSSSGELGYTFGKYLWQSKDSSGKINEARGIFQTIWKKQPDGNWKYVWD